MRQPASKNSTALSAACVSVCQNPEEHACTLQEPMLQQPARMEPNWLQVLYATTRFKSGCAIPMDAAVNAVAAPMKKARPEDQAEKLAVNFACCRCKITKQAVTSVAAWMSALTGVGPAIADGSHRCKPSCADFPASAPSASIMLISAPPFLHRAARSHTSVVPLEC